METFYGKRYFELWIDNKNNSSQRSLEALGYEKLADFPGRATILDKNFHNISEDGVSIKHVTDIATAKDWALVTAKVHNLNEQNLTKFCESAMGKSGVSFYVGYYQGLPVSTRMMIVYEKTVTGYFSATLPEFRRKGIASSVLRFSLNEMRKNGINLYVNQAVSGGSILWKKIGMREYGNIYSCYRKSISSLLLGVIQ